MNTWVKQNAEHWLSSVQLLSRVWLFLTLCSAALQASLSITNSQSLLKLVSIELVMPSNHLILCCPLLLLPSTFPSIRETLTTQQLSKEGIKSRIIQPPCVTGGKKEILVFCFVFSGHQWLLFSISFHSLIPPTQMTAWPRRERRSTFSTYLKPHSYSWLSSLINSSPQAMRILALLYVVS